MPKRCLQPGTALADQGKRREALDCYCKRLRSGRNPPRRAGSASWRFFPTLREWKKHHRVTRGVWPRACRMEAWFEIERNDVQEAVGAGQPFNLASPGAEQSRTAFPLWHAVRAPDETLARQTNFYRAGCRAERCAPGRNCFGAYSRSFSVDDHYQRLAAEFRPRSI